MSYPNSLMELCLCLVVFLYRNIVHFGIFWSKCCLIHSSCSITTFFLKSWNPGRYVFFVKHKKYGKKLNNTWMITFYIGILAIFGNFWANICLVHSTRCLSGCIFAWNHCRQIFSFRITQKIVPVWKYDENFCQKLTKIAKFEVNLGYQGKFWWVHNKS